MLSHVQLAARLDALEQGAGELIAGGAGHVTSRAQHDWPGPGEPVTTAACEMIVNNDRYVRKLFSICCGLANETFVWKTVFLFRHQIQSVDNALLVHYNLVFFVLLLNSRTFDCAG